MFFIYSYKYIFFIFKSFRRFRGREEEKSFKVHDLHDKYCTKSSWLVGMSFIVTCAHKVLFMRVKFYLHYIYHHQDSRTMCFGGVRNLQRLPRNPPAKYIVWAAVLFWRKKSALPWSLWGFFRTPRSTWYFIVQGILLYLIAVRSLQFHKWYSYSSRASLTLTWMSLLNLIFLGHPADCSWELNYNWLFCNHYLASCNKHGVLALV